HGGAKAHRLKAGGFNLSMENKRGGGEGNVINLSCSPAQGNPPEAASCHGRRAMTRPLPLNQAV
ncbi:hypothetical protein, partial [Ectopseudomonas oleovorans]|uniref:hypothetical protein n=1 Tax=Ectopseudomonas oleovorans TaxID=301 RepID=UPI001A8F03F9